MEENDDKKLIITNLNDSKDVNQVLANDTCRAILNLITDEPLSATQISEKLRTPLTTVDYNLKNLQKVDLIGVDHKRWSPKGKKVNFYAPKEKFIVIAPGKAKSDVLQALKSILPVIAVAMIALGFMLGSSFSGTMSSAPTAGSDAFVYSEGMGESKQAEEIGGSKEAAEPTDTSENEIRGFVNTRTETPPEAVPTGSAAILPTNTSQLYCEEDKDCMGGLVHDYVVSDGKLGPNEMGCAAKEYIYPSGAIPPTCACINNQCVDSTGD